MGELKDSKSNLGGILTRTVKHFYEDGEVFEELTHNRIYTL